MHTLQKYLTALGIALLACTGMVQGQGYESVLDKDSLVYTIRRDGFPSTEMEYFFSLRKKTFADSTFFFQGKAYRNLVQADTLEHGVRKIYVHEDTTEGKLWAVNFIEANKDSIIAGNRIADTVERLVMDLSLEKGDTFFVPYPRGKRFPSDTATGFYKKVDTTFSIGDENLKVVDFGELFNYGVSSLRFIESIGPNLGFFFYKNRPPRVPFTNSRIRCISKNGNAMTLGDSVALATFSTFDPIFCDGKPRGYSVGRGSPNTQTSFPKIYPQPATQRINFTLSERHHELELSLRVLNAKGQTVLKRQVSAKQFQLRKPGRGNLYFYQLSNSSGQMVGQGKLIFE